MTKGNARNKKHSNRKEECLGSPHQEAQQRLGKNLVTGG